MDPYALALIPRDERTVQERIGSPIPRFLIVSPAERDRLWDEDDATTAYLVEDEVVCCDCASDSEHFGQVTEDEIECVVVSDDEICAYCTTALYFD